MNINRVVLTGNVVRKPEMKATQGGTEICEFSIATNRRVKSGDEWVDRADFFDCVVFGNSAANAGQMFDKGTPLAIDGTLRQERWETKEGQKRQKVVIAVDNWQFTTRRRDDDGPTYEDAPSADFAAPQADFAAPQASFGGGADDDIPF